MRTLNHKYNNVTVSVVSPFFNEENGISIYKERVEAAVRNITDAYQIVAVDDGSSDHTWDILSKIAAADHKWTVVRLSRNFGHQIALTAGLDHARGQVVFIIDGDLQDPPELLGPMLERWQNGTDVVFGQRRTRKGVSLFKKAAYLLFYRILQKVSDFPIPLDTGDFRLIDHKVLDTIRRMPEQQRFLRGMISWVGFKQEAVPYDRDARAAGEAKYTFNKLIGLAVDGVMSFSIKPLRFAIYLASTAAFMALALIAWVLVGAFLFGSAPQGWTSVMLIILLTSSAQLLVLGITGEYLGKLFVQAKDRPLYLVWEAMNTNGQDK